MHVIWSSSAFLALAQYISHLSLPSACKVNTGYWAAWYDTWASHYIDAKRCSLFFSVLSKHWVNIMSGAGRLLAWATDIEAQLGLQRQELRRSRIELASAQEVLIQPQPMCNVAHFTAMLNIIRAYFDNSNMILYTAASTVAHFCCGHNSQLWPCKDAQPGKPQSVFRRHVWIFQQIGPFMP